MPHQGSLSRTFNSSNRNKLEPRGEPAFNREYARQLSLAKRGRSSQMSTPVSSQRPEEVQGRSSLPSLSLSLSLLSKQMGEGFHTLSPRDDSIIRETDPTSPAPGGIGSCAAAVRTVLLVWLGLFVVGCALSFVVSADEGYRPGYFRGSETTPSAANAPVPTPVGWDRWIPQLNRQVALRVRLAYHAVPRGTLHQFMGIGSHLGSGLQAAVGAVARIPQTAWNFSGTIGRCIGRIFSAAGWAARSILQQMDAMRTPVVHSVSFILSAPEMAARMGRLSRGIIDGVQRLWAARGDATSDWRLSAINAVAPFSELWHWLTSVHSEVVTSTTLRNVTVEVHANHTVKGEEWHQLLLTSYVDLAEMAMGELRSTLDGEVHNVLLSPRGLVVFFTLTKNLIIPVAENLTAPSVAEMDRARSTLLAQVQAKLKSHPFKKLKGFYTEAMKETRICDAQTEVLDSLQQDGLQCKAALQQLQADYHTTVADSQRQLGTIDSKLTSANAQLHTTVDEERGRCTDAVRAASAAHLSTSLAACEHEPPEASGCTLSAPLTHDCAALKKSVAELTAASREAAFERVALEATHTAALQKALDAEAACRREAEAARTEVSQAAVRSSHEKEQWTAQVSNAASLVQQLQEEKKTAEATRSAASAAMLVFQEGTNLLCQMLPAEKCASLKWFEKTNNSDDAFALVPQHLEQVMKALRETQSADLSAAASCPKTSWSEGVRPTMRSLILLFALCGTLFIIKGQRKVIASLRTEAGSRRAATSMKGSNPTASCLNAVRDDISGYDPLLLSWLEQSVTWVYEVVLACHRESCAMLLERAVAAACDPPPADVVGCGHGDFLSPPTSDWEASNLSFRPRTMQWFDDMSGPVGMDREDSCESSDPVKLQELFLERLTAVYFGMLESYHVDLLEAATTRDCIQVQLHFVEGIAASQLQQLQEQSTVVSELQASIIHQRSEVNSFHERQQSYGARLRHLLNQYYETTTTMSTPREAFDHNCGELDRANGEILKEMVAVLEEKVLRLARDVNGAHDHLPTDGPVMSPALSPKPNRATHAPPPAQPPQHFRGPRVPTHLGTTMVRDPDTVRSYRRLDWLKTDEDE